VYILTIGHSSDRVHTYDRSIKWQCTCLWYVTL